MQDGTMQIERLDKATHVSSLEVVGEIYCQLNRGDRSLLKVILVAHADRVSEILDPDAVDRNLPVIGKILGIGQMGGAHGE